MRLSTKFNSLFTCWVNYTQKVSNKSNLFKDKGISCWHGIRITATCSGNGVTSPKWTGNEVDKRDGNVVLELFPPKKSTQSQAGIRGTWRRRQRMGIPGETEPLRPCSDPIPPVASQPLLPPGTMWTTCLFNPPPRRRLYVPHTCSDCNVVFPSFF